VGIFRDVLLYRYITIYLPGRYIIIWRLALHPVTWHPVCSLPRLPYVIMGGYRSSSTCVFLYLHDVIIAQYASPNLYCVSKPCPRVQRSLLYYLRRRENLNEECHTMYTAAQSSAVALRRRLWPMSLPLPRSPSCKRDVCIINRKQPVWLFPLMLFFHHFAPRWKPIYTYINIYVYHIHMYYVHK